MEQLQISMTMHKVEAGTGKVLVSNIVNDTRKYNRVEGKDGESLRLRAADGAAAIDLSQYEDITFLQVTGTYAESDSVAGIVEDSPAPIEYELNGDGTGAFSRASRLTLEGPTNVSALHVRAIDERLVKFSIIVGANA